jgi:hypothetical protein
MNLRYRDPIVMPIPLVRNLKLHHHIYKRLTTQCIFVRFQVLVSASMMFRIVFWDVLPCKIIVYRRFRGAYCLHHQG